MVYKDAWRRRDTKNKWKRRANSNGFLTKEMQRVLDDYKAREWGNQELKGEGIAMMTAMRDAYITLNLGYSWMIRHLSGG